MLAQVAQVLELLVTDLWFPQVKNKTTKSKSNMSTNDSEKLIPASENVTVIRTESPSKTRKDMLLRIGAALFYGVASFMIMVVNKHVLTVHKFPSFQVSPLFNFFK